MIILQSLTGLVLLLAFFILMGLGVSTPKMLRNNFALVPLFGYAACIGLSYIISANFKITGAHAFALSSLFLISSYLMRIRQFSGILTTLEENAELKMFFAIIALPLITILVPAIIDGFQYFYGYVNYDFYFNSQDSVFLQTHNVTQFNKSNVAISPLAWSADFSGRIGEAMIGSFFPKWLHLDALQFNSLLVNTIVILFALSLSVFCKTFFNLRKKATLLAIFCTLLSGSYVQSYSYYVLGQISVLPIFIVYCCFLKNFLDSVAEKKPASNITWLAFILALLLNVMFIMYAIICFFALCITGISYLICMGNPFKSDNLSPWLKALGITLLLFCVVRLLILPETIEILRSWIMLSHRVAEVKIPDTFVVFSDYLTTDFLALLLGIVNYPSPHSLLGILTSPGSLRSSIILGAGLTSLGLTFIVLTSYIASQQNSKAARAIITTLFFILISLSMYFFIGFAGYGIYKLQTWFMPTLIPLYVYYIVKTKHSFLHSLIKIGCTLFLFLNVATGIIYLNDFFAQAKDQHFINVHGLTGNKDLKNIISQIKKTGASPVSLYLNNGMEVAWLANLLRDEQIGAVTHNTQPLIEKDFDSHACQKNNQPAWPTSGVIIVANPNSILSDIVKPPEGAQPLFQNKSFQVFDPNQIQTLIYFGQGSYPSEHYPSKDESFPEVFRWIEQGAAIYVYSNKDQTADLTIEVTPGFVDNKQKPRIIIVKTSTSTYNFTLNKRTTLTIPKQAIHKGLNCLTVESPDKVTQAPTYGALMRPLVSMDPRLNNFAISYVGLGS